MRAFWVKFFFSGCTNLKLVRIRGVARSKYVGWTDMASAERQPITGVWRRTDPPPNHPLCKNSSDLYRFQERPLAKVGWTCPPQSTPWRRHWSEYLGRRAQGYRGIACGVRRHGPQNRYANSSTNQSMSIRARQNRCANSSTNQTSAT